MNPVHIILALSVLATAALGWAYLGQRDKAAKASTDLTHSATKAPLQAACQKLGVPFDRNTIWLSLEHNDDLAVVCARLLLYSDPKPLPDVNDVEGMWQYYLRNWRPGAYDRGSPAYRQELRKKWATHHAQAVKEVSQ